MSETDYIIRMCEWLDKLWSGRITIRYWQEGTNNIVAFGPVEVYRDSEIFVRIQRETLLEYFSRWPSGNLMIVLEEGMNNKGKLLYDNTIRPTEEIRGNSSVCPPQGGRSGTA